MATLYRKYRPQLFSELVGQEHVRTTLTSELESGKIAHAYLFVGPRGIGKTTTARLLAKGLNCTSRKGAEPCNRCTSCTTISQGRSLDLIEIDAASHTQVDHVRENILPAARTAPTLGRYKVFIIDEVHMLSPSAFSALLKMLEEPPAHVVFILATTEPHRLPETIVSRCQRFDFHRIAPNEIVHRLTTLVSEERLRAERTVLERIARLAQGSLRDAEGMLGQLIGLGESTLTDELADLILPRSNVATVLMLIEAILTKDAVKGLELVQRLVDEGMHLGHFLHECVETARSLLLAKIGLRDALDALAPAERKNAAHIAERGTTEDFQRMLETFLRREREERSASIPQLPLELAIVELTSSSAVSMPPSTTLPGREPRSPKSQGGSSPIALKGSQEGRTDWPQVLALVRRTNPSLAVLLKSATPRGIVSDVFVLAFPYPFHCERIVEVRNRNVLESSLATVFGRSLKIEAVLDEKSQETIVPATVSSGSSDDVWQQALAVFGNGSVKGSKGVSS